MQKYRAAILWLLFPLVGVLLSIFLFPLAIENSKKPHAYTYAKYQAANGVELHTLKTKPSNIALKAIDKNVTQTGLYGINGGFFYNSDLLSIAVTNDQPAKGEANDYGTGWYNTDVARGTLIWDEALRAMYIQVVKHAGELQVTDRHHYWAQGGVSMKLGDPVGWEAQMIAEEMPAYDENRLRSATAYDSLGNVWLIVTPTPCTIEQFRSAILQKIVPGQLVDGIFLDGDGSSQLKSREDKLKGDGREVYQILQVVK
ncbi:hypothetical protein GK047_21950 [Paenibacillus sp. SYP-B3998]|uniref:Phosphodiester glycosidase domain-containing protein n=1 Tax=Paenibacillus sp. SYP-B3998 TaxID=2678564 RepID=A0A6G4A2G6_9BACL|nr:hypothetical protein [Paenibacillus sp. SYP-B3998]NEW08663.1 hypothetical protein [Paenibacillus sp. SYP-B3998]